MAQVNLSVRVFYHNEDNYDNAPLKTAVLLSGMFKTADGSKWDDQWKANAIAIMYPYARSLIASITSQSGRQTINLPTINTTSLLFDSQQQN